MEYLHLTFIFLEFIIHAFGNENKRLLLNDPDVIGARFANLEQQNQLLNQKYQDLESKMAQMEARIQHQDQIITTSQSKSFEISYKHGLRKYRIYSRQRQIDNNM